MMKYRLFMPSLLLAAFMTMPMATAQGSGTADEAAVRQQLEDARKELSVAAERVAELSRQLGGNKAVEIRRVDRQRPMIGVVLGPSDEKGVRLQAVTPDGPAAKAGLRSGDIVTRVNDVALDAPQAAARIGDAQRALGRLEQGQQVRLGYEREGRAGEATVVVDLVSPFVVMGDVSGLDGLRALERLGDLDGLAEGLAGLDVERLRADLSEGLGDVEKRIRVIGPMIAESVRFDAWRWQGLRLAPLDADLGRYFGSDEGVLVLKAEGDGLAGLRGGDVIQRIDGESVRTPRDAMRKLSEAEPGQHVTLALLRDRRPTDVALTAPSQPDIGEWLAPPAPPVPPSPPTPPSPPPAPPSAGTLI